MVGRELTKKFETFVRTNLEALQKAEDLVTIKGEFVLVVGGAATVEAEAETTETMSTDDYVSAVMMLMEAGTAKKGSNTRSCQTTGRSQTRCV